MFDDIVNNMNLDNKSTDIVLEVQNLTCDSDIRGLGGEENG